MLAIFQRRCSILVVGLWCGGLWFGAAFLGCSEAKPNIPNASLPNTVSGDEDMFSFGRTEPREISDPEIRRELRVRGEYLVKSAAACGTCHGAEAGQPDSALSGGRAMQDRFGPVHAANITPDKETGIGAWGMADVMRAVRASIAPDGTPLSIDLHSRYRWMSDADVRAVAIYLLSLPPVRSEVPRRKLGQFERRRWGIFSEHRDLSGYVPSIPEQNSLKWGRYLTYYVAGCYGCHTSEGGLLNDSEPFAGGEGSKRGLAGAVKGLFSLISGEISEGQRQDKDATIQALLSKEGSESVYGKDAKPLELKPDSEVTGASRKGLGQKEKYDTSIRDGVFPVAGPDIRGTSASGLSDWSEADIIRYLGTGETRNSEKADGRLCPWPHFSGLKSVDKAAIAKYLKSL